MNIGFAALTMNKDLALTSTAFGVGASMKDLTGVFTSGLYGLAAMLILSGLIVLAIGLDKRLESSPPEPAQDVP